jgi:hypothetical protein
MKKLITVLALIVTITTTAQKQDKLNFSLGFTIDNKTKTENLILESSVINVVADNVIVGVGTSMLGVNIVYGVLGYNIANRLQVTTQLGKTDENFHYANKVMILLGKNNGVLIGVAVDNKNNGYINLGYQF